MLSRRNVRTVPSVLSRAGAFTPKRAFAWRGEQSRANEEAGADDAVAVEIPVENRRLAARMIFEHGGVEGEPGKCRDEQHDAGGSQCRMRHAVEQPEQRDAFERPAERDPLAIELDREDEGDEETARRRRTTRVGSAAHGSSAGR